MHIQASRTSLLLRYLVAQTQQGERHRANEYAIGIEVFGRDAATVQHGRGPDGPGRAFARQAQDLPRIERARVAAGGPRLAFRRLDRLSQGAAANVFTDGLNEALRYRLYLELGNRLATGRLVDRAPGTTGKGCCDAWHQCLGR